MERTDIIAYKKWLQNLDEPAPEGAWDAIADQLDIDTTWESISETLDLDDVWQHIDAGISQEPVHVTSNGYQHFPGIFATAAALLLIVITTPIAEEIQPFVQRDVQHNTIQSGDGNLSGQTTATNSRPITPAVRTPYTTAHDNTTGLAASTVIETGERLSAQDITFIVQAEEQFERAETIVVRPGISLAVTDTLTDVPSDSLLWATIPAVEDSVVVNETPPARPRWQIGLIGSLKNTWLINPETTNGLKRKSLNSTRLTFGKEFGISLQRQVGNQAALQVEYYFYSEVGQRYNNYINALYQTKDIRLRYQKVQFLYRAPVIQNYRTPALYVLGGIGVSRLTLADASIGDENSVVTQQYRPWDYGFILGGEAEFKVGERFLLAPGIRGSYGLRNIYRGDAQLPATFNKTHTASIGISVGIRYKMN